MPTLLWDPPADRINRSNMFAFMHAVNRKYNKQFTTYAALYDWSVTHIADFWKTWWHWAGIIASVPYTQVVDDPEKMPGADWFPGARLNFAENLLRHRDTRTAIIFKGENRPVEHMSHQALCMQVARLAGALRAMGVTAGDRVVGFMPNMPHTVVAMLAAASIGALWSSCSPDFGVQGVIDRFGQIRPKVLFTADGYRFKGKPIDSLGRVADIVAKIPTIEKVVVAPYLDPAPDVSAVPGAVGFDAFLPPPPGPPLSFAQLPFAHPLFIMYSSGTTGLPKCMVQSAGGILVHHLKELVLHTDLGKEDIIFYYTTCGWMMWNWLVSSLAVGAAIVLYDGNPFHPDPGALWQLAQDEGITVFGTSAGYIAALQKTGLRPKDRYDLSPLRTVLSTGAPLPEEGFVFIYDAVKPDVQLSSIAGGTDLNGCFALGNPMGPVYAGEIQCRGLAMSVLAYDEEGRPVFDRQGELVCTKAFPSMPIYFWDDPDGWKYHAAYFDVYPGVWRHGDFIEINNRGGVVIYGRSDATLNPGGVRIGTADIYRRVERFDEIADSVVVGQPWDNDIRVILFVKLMPGCDLTPALADRIRAAIRNDISPRHVPAKILPVPDIPYTRNMKKVEVAVRKIIQGQPVHNKTALSNPEVLDHYADIPELKTP